MKSMEFGLLVTLVLCAVCASTIASDLLNVDDLKEWKKVLRTRTNVMGAFGASKKSMKDLVPMLEKVAGEVKGKGTFVIVDCKEAKKLCKTLKVSPAKYVLRHYQSGSFHKEYDRQLRESSLLSFMKNPSVDAPWSEDVTANDVRHIETTSEFYKTINKEKKPILVMFYAPWCGHCKRMKPEFALAATRLKGKAVLVGMNVDNPESYDLRSTYNITGFPTVLYFEDGEMVYDYWDERTEDSIVKWMSNPSPPPEKASSTIEEQKWSDEESEVVHLLDSSFDDFIASNPSVLVMFYAPWCGHCKALKPQYTEAAGILKSEGIKGKLAAVDATSETNLSSRYKVSGYPTIKYFENGEVMYDYGYGRSTDAIVDFMKYPREPPPPEPDWTEIETKVNHLTDENFKSFLKKKKNALVFFYAPWCGHCKAAKPHFVSAAEKLADKKTALAAVDCTRYQQLCSSHEVQGYPTIKYFNYGKNEFKYMGPRTEEGFTDFMANPTAFSREEL